MADTQATMFSPEVADKVLKAAREQTRRMMNERPHRARYMHLPGESGIIHGIVNAHLGCGRYTIEKATWSGDDATAGVGLGSGSGVGDCDSCYDVTGEGTSACAITLTTPPLQVTGTGVYVTAYDCASTQIPLIVGTQCLITNLGDEDADGTKIWQVVRGHMNEEVYYEETWDCCDPDGPETLISRTPSIMIAKRCPPISCGECPGSGSGSGSV